MAVVHLDANHPQRCPSLHPTIYKAADLVLWSDVHKPCTLETGFSKSHQDWQAGQGPSQKHALPKVTWLHPKHLGDMGGSLGRRGPACSPNLAFPHPPPPGPATCVPVRFGAGSASDLGQPPAFPSTFPAGAATGMNRRCPPVPRLPCELTPREGQHRGRHRAAGRYLPGPIVSGRGGAAQGTTATTKGHARLPLGSQPSAGGCIHLSVFSF